MKPPQLVQGLDYVAVVLRAAATHPHATADQLFFIVKRALRGCGNPVKVRAEIAKLFNSRIRTG